MTGTAGAPGHPVLHAFRGKEFVEYDNRFDVGMTGLIGFSSGYRARTILSGERTELVELAESNLRDLEVE
jgi:hypothetical protein